jgi:fumarylacetoacetase
MQATNETHDPARTSWVESAQEHADFPIQNLPLGVFDSGDNAPRIGTAIGDMVLDLRALAAENLLDASLHSALAEPSLNALFALGRSATGLLRRQLSTLLSDPAHQASVRPHLVPAARCTMHLPARIGDYTDFYVGIHHATNIGKLMRPDNPLLPNYKHIPIGYHGRASSVRASSTPVIRPQGQRKAPDADAPSLAPTARLDYELELGVWIGSGNPLGQPIPIAEAAQHIAGLSLLNDWSARDLQAWEYQPLGPFLAKSFLTTVSPWVITIEALAPFRVAQPPRPSGDPAPLPYLTDAADQAGGAFALGLEVHLSTSQMRAAGHPAHRLSQGEATNMYWTVAQMVAHHSVNGCNLQPGDLLGTGTISGPSQGSFGSLMELSAGGKTPIALPGGETRLFLEDGDEVTLTAKAQAPGWRSIGFGPCTGRVTGGAGVAAA